MTSNTAHSCESDTSVKPQGNFITFGTNLLLDFRIGDQNLVWVRLPANIFFFHNAIIGTLNITNFHTYFIKKKNTGKASSAHFLIPEMRTDLD